MIELKNRKEISTFFTFSFMLLFSCSGTEEKSNFLLESTNKQVNDTVYLYNKLSGINNVSFYNSQNPYKIFQPIVLDKDDYSKITKIICSDTLV